MSGIATWLDTFIDEKDLDRDYLFEVEGPSGSNIIPLGNVVDTIKIAPDSEQQAIKDALVSPLSLSVTPRRRENGVGSPADADASLGFRAR